MNPKLCSFRRGPENASLPMGEKMMDEKQEKKRMKVVTVFMYVLGESVCQLNVW